MCETRCAPPKISSSDKAPSWSPQEAAQQAWRAMQQAPQWGAPQGTGAPTRADPYAEAAQQEWRDVQQAPAPYLASAPSATIAPGSADGMRLRLTRVSSDTDGAPADLPSAPPAALEPPGGGVEDAAGDRASKVLVTRAGQPKRALPRPGQEVLGPRPPQKCAVARCGTSSAGGAGPRLVVSW